MADFLLSVGVDVGLSYDQMQKDISNLVSQLNNNPPKIKIGVDIDNASIEAFKNQVAEISKSLSGLGHVTTTSATASSASSAAASMADVAAKTREAAAAAQAAGNSYTNTAAKVNVLRAGTTEYYTALKQVSTLLNQVTHSQERWTMAKTGSSSSAYNDLALYAEDLKALEQQLRNGAITADDFRLRMTQIRSGVSSATTTIKSAGEATQTWGQRIGTLSAKFGTWFSITRVIMAAYRAVRQMVTNVIELDTAMTELKKVTDGTDATYESFLVRATSRAKELGAALSDTVNATADFARLGYGIEDAEKLADAAIVYKNVGDGIEDIGDASESIIATMQAFHIPAEQVMSIVDRFNEVGNNFAISSRGVGDALLRSAAALQSANNTLDESIALATAANTIVQDPEKVGTTLKTVAMYLRAAKTDAEDAGESTEGMANSVSELREEILALTGGKVDIQIDEDTFKSTYQILKELSAVWGELTDVSQANILEMIGGKRNSNVVSALLEDFSIAEEAVVTSANSAGSALEENEKVLESIQGKLDIMKATFEALSQNLIGTDIVKFVVDTGTALMELVNGVLKVVDALGGFKTVLLTVSAALIISKGGLIAYKAALLGVTAVEKITTFFIGLKNGILNIVGIIPNAIAAWQAYAAGIVSANTAIQASIPVIGLVLAAISAVVAGVSLAGGSISKTQKTVEELNKEWDGLADSVQSTAQQFQSLKQNADEIIPRYAELAQGVDKYGENISLTDKEFEEFVSLNNQLGEIFPDLVVGYDANGNAILNLSGNVDTLTESLYACVEAQRAAASQEIADTMPDVVENINDTTDALEKQIDTLKDSKDSLEDFYKHLKDGGAPSKQKTRGYWHNTEKENDRAEFYDTFGVSANSYTTTAYPPTNASRGVTVTNWKYVFDDGAEENLQKNYEAAEAVIDKQIKAIEDKISAKNKQINPVITAWLQTNFLYNDLDKTGQDIVSQIVKSIDFKDKGLDTAEKIQEYIENDIITPLYDAEPEVKNAIAGLFEIKNGFEAGEATVGEYKTLVDNIISDLKKAGLSDDIIKQIKITMDTEGFEEKVDYVKGLLSDEYDSMVDTLTSSELDVAYQISAAESSMTFDELKSKIEELQFETAPMVDVLDFGDMTSSLDKAKDGLDNIIDAMSKLKSGTTLTKSELAQLALEYPKLLEASNIFTDGSIEGQKNMLNTILDMQEQEYDAEIDKKIAELEATEQVLQDQLDLESQKSALIQEIKNIEANGVLGQEADLVQKISELNDLQGKNYVSMEDGILTVNQEALNKHLNQDEDFGNKSASNIWAPFAKTIKTAHTKGFSAALQAANNYGSKLASWAKNIGSSVLSGLGNAVKDALSGEWKGIKSYFSGVATNISAPDVTVTFDGGSAFVGNQSLSNWVSEQEKASKERITQTQELLQKTLNAKNNLAALKGLDLADVYGGSNNKNNNTGKKDKDKDKKEVDEYIAEVERYNEALQKLKDIEQEQAELERELENTDGALEKVDIQKKLNQIYTDKQNALHELNNLRDDTIHNTIPQLEALGFQIEYNDEANRLYIANLEHLNELQADSAGKYETVQEATNALRKETEELIDDITNLNEENADSSEEWLTLADNIEKGKDKIVEYLNEAVTEAIDFVSAMQDVYSTLKDAADEYAETGALSVDSLKAIAEYGAEYMSYLKDENGMLSINKERIEAVITARTKQLAVDTAMSYVEKLRYALSENNIKEINRLISATEQASDATWGLVYSNLALLNLNDSQYSQALENINRLRSLADSAVESIKLGADESSKSYEDMQDALDKILDLTMELVKYEVNQQIEALEKQKDNYREIIDLKKESLEETKKENDYNKEVAKKVAKIAKLQDKINKLSLDDSREAQAEKASLEQELAELQTDLSDYQADYSIDKQQDMLDKMADSYEEEKDKEIAALEESISSTEKIYQLAIDRINNNWNSLYDDIINWNYEAGSSIESEIVEAWEQASKAVQKYGSYVEATNKLAAGATSDDIGKSGNYGDPKAIINQMRSNSLKWLTASDEEQSRLASANKTLASQLSDIYEQGVTSRDGSWYLDGETNPLYSIGKWEAVDYITKAMKNNSAKWNNAAPNERAALEKANEKMAGYISDLSGQKVWKDSDGVWWIDDAKLYDSYGTYHTGGVVGESNLKKDEVMAILKDGELVLDEKREKELYKLVDFAQLLSERLGTAIDTSKLDNLFGGLSVLPTPNELLHTTKADSRLMEFSPSIEVNISHNGSMSDNDARRYGGIIAETALGELKDAFTKKGFTNIGNSALK